MSEDIKPLHSIGDHLWHVKTILRKDGAPQAYVAEQVVLENITGAPRGFVYHVRPVDSTDEKPELYYESAFVASYEELMQSIIPDLRQIISNCNLNVDNLLKDQQRTQTEIKRNIKLRKTAEKLLFDAEREVFGDMYAQ